MLCIYCQERESDAREHPVPQCLGGFHNFEPLLNRICQPCNEAIGREVEVEFARRSPEAVLRNLSWVKRGSRSGKNKRAPNRAFQPKRVGGQHLSLLALDPEEGHQILWEPDKLPNTIKPISQFVILDAVSCEPIQYIPVPAELTTLPELIEVFKKHAVTFPIPKVKVIVASGDEERIEGLLAAWGVTCIFERRKGGLVQGPKVSMGEVSPQYFRALAKIGFHYALKNIPTILGNEGAFRPLREFIRNGTGDWQKFLSSRETVESSDAPPGHVLSVLAPSEGQIVVLMQFFVGSGTALRQWRLMVGKNPTVLHLNNQMCAHFFSYAHDEHGYLRGGNVVKLEVVP